MTVYIDPELEKRIQEFLMNNYQYLCYKNNDTLGVFCTNNFEDICAKDYSNGATVLVLGANGKRLHTIENEEHYLEWREVLEKTTAWKPVKWDPLGEAGIESKKEEFKDNAFNETTVVHKYLGKTPVNPKHYQDFFKGSFFDGNLMLDINLQWLESKQYLARYRNPDIFIGAVKLLADKYFDRLGGKDPDVQEIMKGIWYYKFLAAYIKNGCNPIRVVDIPKILGDEV